MFFTLLSSEKWASLACIPTLNLNIARFFVTKITNFSPYNAHNTIHWMTFMELYNIKAMQVIDCTISWTLYDSWYPFVYLIQCMTFMFPYITMIDSLWVQYFFFKEVNPGFADNSRKEICNKISIETNTFGISTSPVRLFSGRYACL